MKSVLAVILSILIFFVVYFAIMLFTSWLTILLFGIWGICLPFINVFQSLILVSLIYSILFSSSKKIS